MAERRSRAKSHPTVDEEGHQSRGGRREGPRAFWSGTITFGLVSIPVELFPGYRSSRVGLRMLAPGGRPVQRRYICPKDEKILDYDDLVKGHQIADEKFVVISDEELAELAPRQSREIDLRRFVPRDQIDPMLFDRAYFLMPDKEISKPYRLLATIMERTGRVGIASFVMRGHFYVIAIFSERGILRGETLRYADEVRSVDDVGLPHAQRPPAELVKTFRKAIRELGEDRLDPDELGDEQAEALRKLAQAKAKKGEDVVEVEEPAGAEAEGDEESVVDIMELLKRRLGARLVPEKKGSSGGSAAKSSSAKPTSDLGSKTKTELMLLAKKADLPGRSSMSKDELVKALSKQARKSA